MSHLSHDFTYMARAMQLAKKGLYTTQPNPRVGCVIVNKNQIVGEGYHHKAGEPHAEIFALKQAGENAQGATAYVSLEPCAHHGKTPPCADALINAGIKRVVCAMQDPNPLVAGQGLERLQQAGIETSSGVLQAEAQALNPGFIKRMQTGLPYVRVKLAMSLDGRTAMASGESKWITGEAARHDVQKMRARSSIVLTGSGTVIADNPSMNLRLDAAELGIENGIEPFQPLRGVIDSQLVVEPDSQVFKSRGDTLIFTLAESIASSGNAKKFKAAQLVTIKPRSGKLDLLALMQYLAEQQVNEVHVEAGSKLCGALLALQLVDEIVIYMAPNIMGDSAKGLFHLPQLQSMKQRTDLSIKDVRAIGKDWRIIAVPEYSREKL